jgi:hypothetical protein
MNNILANDETIGEIDAAWHLGAPSSNVFFFPERKEKIRFVVVVVVVVHFASHHSVSSVVAWTSCVLLNAFVKTYPRGTSIPDPCKLALQQQVKVIDYYQRRQWKLITTSLLLVHYYLPISLLLPFQREKLLYLGFR